MRYQFYDDGYDVYVFDNKKDEVVCNFAAVGDSEIRRILRELVEHLNDRELFMNGK